MEEPSPEVSPAEVREARRRALREPGHWAALALCGALAVVGSMLAHRFLGPDRGWIGAGIGGAIGGGFYGWVVSRLIRRHLPRRASS